METQAPSPSGLLGSLRGFADGLIGTIHDRVELLSIELHEEKYRLIQIFIWISATVFTGMLAIIFASLVIVYCFWDTARLTVLASLAGVYIAAFTAVLTYFRRFLSHQPKPFAATLGELKEDRVCIRPEN
ncbi:MAG: phage holin family protein [Opitutaceae bacterium]